MFNLKVKPKSDPMDATINELLNDLKAFTPDSAEYEKAVDQLARLHKLKETDSKKRVSPDVLVTAGTNLAGILLILQYERIHVVTSKALGFVAKLR